MSCTPVTFLFSLTLLLVPIYVKCDFIQWHHMFLPNENDYSEDLCFDDRNCASGKHCIDNECRCIGSDKGLHVGKTCYQERNYGEECELHIQCPLFERCINGTCQCAQEYIDTVWDGCQPTGQLDDLCFADAQCIAPHSSCIDNRCKCSPGYGDTIHNTCEPEYTTIKVYLVSHDGQEMDPHDDALHMVARELGHTRADQKSLETKEIMYKNPHLRSERKRAKRSISLSDKLSSALGNFKAPGVNMGNVNSRPVPKLDQRCDRTSECYTVDNAICKSKSCKCKPGYVKKPGNNKECFDARSIGLSCAFDQQCPPNAFCQSTCKCKSNTVKISSKICAPVKQFGDYCKYVPQCSTTDSKMVCSHGVCKCGAVYVDHQSTCYSKKKHGEECQHTVQCPSNENCVVTCQCKNNYFHIQNIGCVPELDLGQTCLYSQQCAARVDYSKCGSTSKCECESGFIRDGSTCLREAAIGDHCDVSDQCTALNSRCSTGKVCECNPDFYECSQDCWGGKELGGACLCSDQCTTPNAQCIIIGNLQQCGCPNGYVMCSSTCLPTKSISQDCTCDAQCVLENSICYRGKKCWCRDGYQHGNGQCTLKTIRKTCTTDETCTSSDLFSECQGNTCACSATYTEAAQKYCKGDAVPLTGGCTTVEECQRNDRYSTCGTNGQCKCITSFTDVGGICTPKVSTIGTTCSTCIECVRGNPRTKCSDAGQCICSEVAGSKPDPSNANNCIPKECGATYSSVSSALTITSPSLSDGYYWNNADCLWTFTTSSTAFKIEILSFATETPGYPDLCVLDYVTINDNSGCFINLCGDYDAGTTIYINEDYVEIYFSSNEKFRKKGFEMKVTPVDVSTIPSSCNAPTRNKDVVSWMNDESCFEPAEDFIFETTVLTNVFPQWYSS